MFDIEHVFFAIGLDNTLTIERISLKFVVSQS